MTCDRYVIFVVALPRSRTAWLANFLSSDAHAMHEPLSEHGSVEVLARRVDALPPGAAVIADTGAAMFIDEILRTFPNARFCVVTREPRDVKRSIRGMGLSLEGFDKVLAAFERAKTAILKSDRSGFWCDSEKLDHDGTVMALWDWMFEGAANFDHERYSMLRDFRVEAIPERMIAKIRPGALDQLAKAMTRT